MVHTVRDKHPELFKVDLRPAAPHPDDLAHYQLGSHGVVCLGSDGQVLWKHPGHELIPQELDTGVQQVLKILNEPQAR